MTIKTILYFIILCNIPANLFADVIWPAIYIAESHFHFWYVVVIGMLLEAGIIYWRLIPSIKKALLISFVSNAVSATIGVYLLVYGMLGWHLYFDGLIGGTFAEFNKIATIFIMMSGSTFIEMLVTRLIWKYPMGKTLFVFIIGNLLSYAVVFVDLFYFDGWQRTY